jgi:hypothetical protein
MLWRSRGVPAVPAGPACGLTEKGYRVGVMEDLPKSQWHLPGFLWFPAAELHMAASSSQLTIGDRTPPRCLLDGLAVGVVLWV